MGTIKQGILGGFSGKVGTVVGGSWKGISYMRSLAQNVKDPRTPAQMGQRTKFGITIRLLKPLTALLRVGWRQYADGMSAFNAAMAYTLANAITGAYPDYAIDPSKILISRGSLTPATGASATASGENITFNWSDNSGAGSAAQTDRALIAVLNPALGEAVSTDEAADRMTLSQTIALPPHWAGDNVYTYLGFISEDARETANSIYLGYQTVIKN
jgi:hypothetical protein